jgi:hypothetical protein
MCVAIGEDLVGRPDPDTPEERVAVANIFRAMMRMV